MNLPGDSDGWCSLDFAVIKKLGEMELRGGGGSGAAAPSMPPPAPPPRRRKPSALGALVEAEEAAAEEETARDTEAAGDGSGGTPAERRRDSLTSSDGGYVTAPSSGRPSLDGPQAQRDSVDSMGDGRRGGSETRLNSLDSESGRNETAVSKVVMLQKARRDSFTSVFDHSGGSSSSGHPAAPRPPRRSLSGPLPDVESRRNSTGNLPSQSADEQAEQMAELLEKLHGLSSQPDASWAHGKEGER